MAALSVVVLTKNEEANIRECLESVSWADEIIVIDDESTDATREIAREFASKIIVRKMHGFGAQRQAGIEEAGGEWILFLDADERVPYELKQEMQAILAGRSAGFDGFAFVKKTFYLGKEIKYCGWSAPVPRFFKKSKGRSDQKMVHEEIIVDGPVGSLKHCVLHYSYTSIFQHIEKMNKYTEYDATELYAKGVRINLLNFGWCWFVKPAIAFARKYVLQKGFLDGKEGLLISVFTAWVVFLHYVKVWEMQKKRHAP